MARLKHWTLLLTTSIAAAALAAACGSSGDGSADGSSNTPTGDAGGPPGTGGAGGDLFGSTSSGAQSVLTISPQDPVLEVEGTPESLQFQAAFGDGSPANNVAWEVSDIVLGTMDDTGTLTAKGLIAGVATVTARTGTLTATTTVTVRVRIVDNAGGISADDQVDLQNGGSADPDLRFLYPYDNTVFPRGLRAPDLQLGGAPASATYVRITQPNFSYEGFFGPSSPTRVALSQEMWRAVTLSATANDPVTVEVTTLSGAGITGPVTETWRVAQGDLKGVIYYNTYKSAQTSTGAVMRVRPNVNAEVFIGGCTVCHSVSANGNVLAAGVNWGDAGNPLDSATFNLLADGTYTTRELSSEGRKMSFGGLTPNGDMMLSSGVPAGSPVRGLAGPLPSRLYDTASGNEIAAPSFTNAVQYALTPAFSPNNARVAFTQYEQGINALRMMDFNPAAAPPEFTNLQTLATSARAVAGWPSFLPDAAAVVFHDGDAFDTNNGNGGARYAELRLVDVVTKAVSGLNLLNGRDAAGANTLPYGEGEELNMNYEPTVLPVAVGGYYWVVFTSRRAYGNTIAPGGTVPGGSDKWGTNGPQGEVPSVRKKLWIAAININYQNQPDPSHPAFYLGEQELEAGNMRAFMALDPCKDEGGTCESGAECCNGLFCRQTGDVNDNGEPITACVPPQTGECANIDETCETAADCCDTTALCINNRCAVPPPQ
ncbi:hypothetical protein [Chondromyces apiculatus]|uniref:BIG2 domain-containing protein n=1 Tax=Chondromyces apiculatus DSM 436 TaxID=1192034 RepID=A0A017TFF0_9BACT|nr:hypothetical protein [Chondromyces apiculatus]EYF07637.1 Hypothetical protein CAP_8138 [Chondromyces apiculatus DSM 436]